MYLEFCAHTTQKIPTKWSQKWNPKYLSTEHKNIKWCLIVPIWGIQVKSYFYVKWNFGDAFYRPLTTGCDTSTNCGGYACNNNHVCLVGLQSITLKTQSCTGCQGAQVYKSLKFIIICMFLNQPYDTNLFNFNKFLINDMLK